MAPPEPPAGAPRAEQASDRNFYDGDCLSEAERLDLRIAAEVEGIGDEIAMLRVRLKTALRERPEDYALMVRGVGVLVRAVSAQYRLSPRASKDLERNLGRVLDRFPNLILPADR